MVDMPFLDWQDIRCLDLLLAVIAAVVQGGGAATLPAVV
jgi:hypothetical protein